jgi:hypothetical protein
MSARTGVLNISDVTLAPTLSLLEPCHVRAGVTSLFYTSKTCTEFQFECLVLQMLLKSM